MKTRSFIFLTITLLGLFVSCDRMRQPSPKTVARIENLTKVLIASNDCVTDEYADAVDAMQECLDNGMFTERGFVGSGLGPDEIKSQCKYNIELLGEILDAVSDNLFDAEYVDKTFPQGSDKRKMADKIIKKMEDVRADLSKFEPVEVAGKTKMWRYTELNTGYKFMATMDKDKTVFVKFQDGNDLDDVIEEWSEYVKQIDELYKEFQYGGYNLSEY